jgi:hypothetical protein
MSEGPKPASENPAAPGSLKPEAQAAAPEAKAAAAPRQLDLFTEYLPHPVVDALRKVDLNALSPMQAFDVLRTLIESLKRS